MQGPCSNPNCKSCHPGPGPCTCGWRKVRTFYKTDGRGIERRYCATCFGSVPDDYQPARTDTGGGLLARTRRRRLRAA